MTAGEGQRLRLSKYRCPRQSQPFCLLTAYDEGWDVRLESVLVLAEGADGLSPLTFNTSRVPARISEYREDAIRDALQVLQQVWR